LIDEIRKRVAGGDFEFSQHAVDQAIIRHISVQELREAIAGGERSLRSIRTTNMVQVA